MRRWHNKSRSGCVKCKQRRIKCDETRPACHNCVRASKRCSFLRSPSSPNSPAEEEEEPSRAVSSTALSLTSRELELLHHYYTVTCYTVATNPACVLWLQETAPRYGFQNDFCLKAMLAYAASHMARIVPYPKHYNQFGEALRCDAMAQASPAIRDPQVEQCAPLFTCSVFVGCAAFASAAFEIEHGRATAVQCLITVGKIFRGCLCLVQAYMQLTGGEPKGFHPPTTKIKSSATMRNLNFDEICVTLRTFATKSVRARGQSDAAALPFYFAVIDHLGLCALAYEQERDANQMGLWLANLDFLELLEKGDEIAEAITMFYGIFLHRLDDVWWFGGLGRLLVEELARILGQKSPEGVHLACMGINRLNVKEELPEEESVVTIRKRSTE